MLSLRRAKLGRAELLRLCAPAAGLSAVERSAAAVTHRAEALLAQRQAQRKALSRAGQRIDREKGRKLRTVAVSASAFASR